MKKLFFGIFFVLFFVTVIFSQGSQDNSRTVKPKAVISSSYVIGVAPLEVEVTGKYSTPKKSIVSYAWLLDDQLVASSIDFRQTFEKPGTYILTLKVVTKDGQIDEDSIFVVVTKPAKKETKILQKEKEEVALPLKCNENGLTGPGAIQRYGLNRFSLEWDFEKITPDYCLPKKFGGKGKYCDAFQLTTALEKSLSKTKKVLDNILPLLDKEESEFVLNNYKNSSKWLLVFKKKTQLKTGFGLDIEIFLDDSTKTIRPKSHYPEINQKEFEENFSVVANSMKEKRDFETVKQTAQKVLSVFDPVLSLQDIVAEYHGKIDGFPEKIKNSPYLFPSKNNCPECESFFLVFPVVLDYYREASYTEKNFLADANFFPVKTKKFVESNEDFKGIAFDDSIDKDIESLKIFEFPQAFNVIEDRITTNFLGQYSENFKEKILQFSTSTELGFLDTLSWVFNASFETGTIYLKINPIFSRQNNVLKATGLAFSIEKQENIQEKYEVNPFLFASFDAGITGKKGKRDFGVFFEPTSKFHFYNQTDNLEKAVLLSDISSGQKKISVKRYMDSDKLFSFTRSNKNLSIFFNNLEPVLLSFDAIGDLELYYAFEAGGKYLTPSQVFKDKAYLPDPLLKWSDNKNNVYADQFMGNAKGFCEGWNTEIPVWKTKISSNSSGKITSVLLAPPSVNLAFICIKAPEKKTFSIESINVDGNPIDKIDLKTNLLFSEGGNSLKLSSTSRQRVFSLAGMLRDVEKGRLCISEEKGIEKGLSFSFNSKQLFKEIDLTKSIPGEKPFAKINVFPESAFPGKEVVFDASNSKGKRFKWSFGDNSEAEGVIVKHSYAYPRKYIVTLTAFGSKNTSDKTVLVYNVKQKSDSEKVKLSDILENEKNESKKAKIRGIINEKDIEIKQIDKKNSIKKESLKDANACFKVTDCSVSTYVFSGLNDLNQCKTTFMKDGIPCNKGQGVCQQGKCVKTRETITTKNPKGKDKKEPIITRPVQEKRTKENVYAGNSKYSMIVMPLKWNKSNEELKSVAQKMTKIFLDYSPLNQCREQLSITFLSKEQVASCNINYDLTCLNGKKKVKMFNEIENCAKRYGFNRKNAFIRLVAVTDEPIGFSSEKDGVEVCPTAKTTRGFTSPYDNIVVVSGVEPEQFNFVLAHELGHTFGFCEQYSRLVYVWQDVALKLLKKECKNKYPGTIGAPDKSYYEPQSFCSYEKGEFSLTCPEFSDPRIDCDGRKVPVNNKVGRSFMGAGVKTVDRAYDCFEEKVFKEVWPC